MKVSAQEEYGLRCMLQLATRQKSGDSSPLTLGEIAREEGLTVPHVAKLMGHLRHAANGGQIRPVISFACSLARKSTIGVTRSGFSASAADFTMSMSSVIRVSATPSASGWRNFINCAAGSAAACKSPIAS